MHSYSNDYVLCTLSQLCIATSIQLQKKEHPHTDSLCCTGEVVDEQTAQEETEDKLRQCIDNLMDKRYQYVLKSQSY